MPTLHVVTISIESNDKHCVTVQREKEDHAVEMNELQEKLRKDMLAFQEKLQHVQQQTMLNKAENLAKEAEVR